MEDLKKVIADNIIFYRKEKGYTQLELAEKLNYSDKAVSKWERAESLPDVITLNEIASMLDVTLNDLVSVKKKVRIRKPLTVCFSVGLVWLVATVVFVLINILTKSSERSWLVFCMQYRRPRFYLSFSPLSGIITWVYLFPRAF